MLKSDLDRRELRDLWISVAIAISLAIYHVSFSLIILFREAILGYSQFLTDVIYVWILGLLLVAYRRWKEATRRQKELRNIIRSISTEVIMVVSPDRTIRMCNESVKQIFGYEAAELAGQKTDLLYLDRRKNRGQSGEIFKAVEQVGFHVGNATGTRKNGEFFPLEIVTALLQGQQGAVLLMRDVTERQRAETAIFKAKAEAEAADAAKGQLLSALETNYRRLQELEKLRDNLTHMIVHDMRTPVQVILTSIDLLRRQAAGVLAPQARGWIENIEAQTTMLMTMFNSVLDVSRLEAGSLPLQLAAGDLRDVLREALESLGALAARHRIVTRGDGPPVRARIDPEVIRRVLVNLLTNAIKFTPAGGEITIEVSSDAGRAVVSVTDSGPDIPREYHAQIFEKFGQVEAGQQKKMHSAGLGLTFCKLAVEAHQGTIVVESEPGRGATFRLTLPLAEP